MGGPNIAFLHVGRDVTLPAILVRSIRASNPSAYIIQCTDPSTSVVEGVDEVLRHDGDASHLMSFRLEAFAKVSRPEPTLFLDTDMICLQPLDPAAALGGREIAICRREYQNDVPINPHAMGMDIAEYDGRTLGQIYPYLACAAITRTPDFWRACRDELATLPEKFRIWFGDQEAMRNVVDSGKFETAWLEESTYACLLDLERNRAARPKICHFKGPSRKSSMLDVARRLRVLPATRSGVIEIGGVSFDLGAEDLANLALQRTGPLIAAGHEAALTHWFSTGDKTLIAAALSEPAAARAFLTAVVAEAARDVGELCAGLDLSAVNRIASIGPGLGLIELMLHRRQPAELYMIDIESSAVHQHGFSAQGSGYSSNTAAQAFLVANGVPPAQLSFCNPRRARLDTQPVDLIMSLLSMGFHYPTDEYVTYIEASLRPGGLLIFDKRKAAADSGWNVLAPRFEQVSRTDLGKAWRLVCRRRA